MKTNLNTSNKIQFQKNNNTANGVFSNGVSLANIHPTAIIGNNVILSPGVEVGPYCVIRGDVFIAENVKLHSHVVIDGNVKIDKDTEVYPFAVIGNSPMDLKYQGEKVFIEIGKNNQIREHVTIQPGTKSGISKTIIGDNNLIMVGCHIAHDCVMGNNIVISKGSNLAGHVIVEDNVIIGGMSGVHQHVRLGRNAMIGGMTSVVNDLIPFGLVKGERGDLAGLNIVGMKRSGMSRESIAEVRNVFKAIFESEGSIKENVSKIKDEIDDNSYAYDIIRFIEQDSNRSLCVPKARLN